MKDFSHVPNFTDYMGIAEEVVLGIDKAGLEILDMPAGNGLLANRLRNYGHKVVCADINSERPEYVYVNMESSLPFPEASFDVVICLEGIEHVINPYSLIKELCRVLKPNGTIVMSLPNMQSLYSRIQFLLSGTFYQYEPENCRHPKGALQDRGHISPISLVELTYLFGEFGLSPQLVTGDRIKKKILLPIYLILWAINLITAKFRTRNCSQSEVKQMYGWLTCFRPMMSRSLVTVWKRNDIS